MDTESPNTPDSAKVTSGPPPTTTPALHPTLKDIKTIGIKPSKNLTGQSLAKLFQKAKKELGARAQSTTAPNLSLKRPRPQQDPSYTGSSADDSQNWQLPKRAVRNTPQYKPVPPTQTRNSYLALDALPQEVAFEHGPRKSKSTAPASSRHRVAHPYLSHRRTTPKRAAVASTNVSEDSSDDDTRPQVQGAASQSASPSAKPPAQPNGKRLRPPPIFTTGILLSDLAKLLLNKGFAKGDFYLRQTDAESVTLCVTHIDNFKRAGEILAAVPVEHHTFTPSHEKPRNLVLKGIFGNFTAEEVKQDLIDLAIPGIEVTKVSELSYRGRAPQAQHFLVQLKAGSNVQAVTKERFLLNQKIRWETLRKPPIFQCTNCLDVGHSSANCRRKFRCSRCSKDHAKGECAIPVNNADKSVLFCRNCNVSGHSASYGGCPYLKFVKEYKADQKASRQAAVDLRLGRVSARVAGGHAHHTSAPPNPPNAWATPNSARLFQPPPAERADGPNLNTLLVDFETRIMSALKSQLDVLLQQITSNSHRLDFVFETLGFYDGSH